ncbi:ShlB/FhaC/HecB family hemolysin secretion/activation protein [Kiritimatiellaeota bacterium B1221]|nr:ShlB/FhaC/HecB family hemolysin secretion/activation protein [Kiritimatiellaeota bacterium B1221]
MKLTNIVPPICLLTLCSFLPAQDLDKVLPETVPKQVKPVEPVDMPRITQTQLDEMGMKIWATPDEEIIMPKLKGVRLIGSPTLLDDGAISPGRPLEAKQISGDYSDELLIVVSAYLEKPVSVESTERMIKAQRFYLAQIGHPFSQVYLPPQDITDGILQFVVIESTLGEIRVEGNSHFTDQSYLSRIPVSAGDPIDTVKIQAGITRINLNPFRDATPQFAKGDKPGTADIVLLTSDSTPYRLFAGVNNTGSPSTTEERVSAGINWGNAFWRADQMTLQWTSDFEAKHSKAVSTNYTSDLPGGNSFTFFGAYSEIESKTEPDFDQAGESWQLGLNLDLPLRALGSRYNHNLQFGLDFKSSDNNLDFLQPPFIIPVSDNVTHIVQARAQYQATVQDAYGYTSFGLKLTASPGDLTSRNTDEAFEASRAYASATYLYGNANLFRDTRLPKGWNWTIHAETQQANGNLLGSESFSGGGFYSVRGYEEGEVIGDNGFLLSQELLLPPFSPARGWGVPDALRIFIFEDYAQLGSEEKLPGEESYELHSVGAGLNYQLSRYATFRLAYGWQLEQSGASVSGDNTRAHFSLDVSF